MELHSYAKRKAAKKWTVEQKRKLVEARIAYDGIFSKKPLNCLMTWKKVVSLAKLDDFNVSFVRKQWANMVAKYKQYKRSRLGSSATSAIDDELLRKVSQEWEFFAPIHAFMSRKITNLHSYALTEGQKQKQSSCSVLTHQQQQEQEANNASLASQLEKMLSYNNGSSPEIEPAQNVGMFSSDTNEDFAAAAEIVANEVVKDALPLAPSNATNDIKIQAAAEDADDEEILDMQQALNTDHDFYSKKSPKQKNYFSDDTEEEQKRMKLRPKKNGARSKNQTEGKTNLDDFIQKQQSNGRTNNNTEKVQNNKKISTEEAAGTQSTTKNAINAEEKPCSSKSKQIKTANTHSTDTTQNHHKSKLSERDKYYRHKRRFNRRLERRFDSILNVFGQIVKAEYPSINVHPLLGATAKLASYGVGLRFPEQEHVNGMHETGNADEEATSSDSSSTTEDAAMTSSYDDGDEHAESRSKSTTGGLLNS